MQSKIHNYDVFLSYDREDTLPMEFIIRRFKNSKLRVWVDRDGITDGDDWRSEIHKAIDASYCLVVLSSPESVVSKWVKEELAYAEHRNKKVFVVLIRGDDADRPFGYYHIQYTDIRRNKTENLRSLIKSIKVYIASSTNTKINDSQDINSDRETTSHNKLDFIKKGHSSIFSKKNNLLIS